MAMNRKEREEYEAALLQIEILKAFRWTKHVEPDIPVPIDKKEVTYGWSYNVATKTIYKVWSHKDKHGDMPYTPIYGRGGGRALYSEAKALAALRHAIEKQAAEDLLEIDRKIEKLTHG